MATVTYHNAIKQLFAGELNLSSDDIRVALLMTNTTADTESDIDFISDITTIDECDATGYSRVALANESVSVDDANNLAKFDADDAVFSGLGADATRDYQGALIYKHVTNDSDSVPIVFIDFTTDVPKTATQVTLPWPTDGIIKGVSN